MRINNNFLIFSIKIHLKDAALLYPHNLTVYKVKAYLLERGILLVDGGYVASYWEIYC